MLEGFSDVWNKGEKIVEVVKEIMFGDPLNTYIASPAKEVLYGASVDYLKTAVMWVCSMGETIGILLIIFGFFCIIFKRFKILKIGLIVYFISLCIPVGLKASGLL